MTSICDPLSISVVVVCHNYEAYVAEAIQSALDQTRPPDEIIVIDDGSTDGSISRIRSFGDQVRLHCQENGGHISAFQAGYSLARGALQIYLDADDILYPQCLASIESAWIQRTGAAKVQFRLDTIDKAGHNQNMTFPHLTRELTPEVVRERAFRTGIYPWTVCSGNAYAKVYLDKILPIDVSRVFRSPDGYANKMAPLYGDVVSLPDVLGAYRVHGKKVWAQGAALLNIAQIQRTVQLDLNLDEVFRERAEAEGRPIALRMDLTTPQHLEYRLLSLRAGPTSHPVVGDTQGKLIGSVIRSVFTDPALRTRARLFWSLWAVALGLLPRRTIQALYLKMRSQTGRSGFAKSLVTMSRARR